MKSSNQILSEKVSELEKRVCELQEDMPVAKNNKLSPSREVRVSYPDSCSSVRFLFFLLISSCIECLQMTVFILVYMTV